jgi:hypothetical protein
MSPWTTHHKTSQIAGETTDDCQAGRAGLGGGRAAGPGQGGFDGHARLVGRVEVADEAGQEAAVAARPVAQGPSQRHIAAEVLRQERHGWDSCGQALTARTNAAQSA